MLQPAIQEPDDTLVEDACLSKAGPSDALSDGTSSTEEEGFKIEALTKALKEMRLELAKRDKKIEEMQLQMDLEKTQQASKKGELPATLELEGEGDAAEDMPNVDARRQSLRRLCGVRKANGQLKVPQKMHDDYMAGGASRDRPMKVFVDCRCDKVGHACMCS